MRYEEMEHFISLILYLFYVIFKVMSDLSVLLQRSNKESLYVLGFIVNLYAISLAKNDFIFQY